MVDMKTFLSSFHNPLHSQRSTVHCRCRFCTSDTLSEHLPYSRTLDILTTNIHDLCTCHKLHNLIDWRPVRMGRLLVVLIGYGFGLVAEPKEIIFFHTVSSPPYKLDRCAHVSPQQTQFEKIIQKSRCNTCTVPGTTNIYAIIQFPIFKVTTRTLPLLPQHCSTQTHHPPPRSSSSPSPRSSSSTCPAWQPGRTGTACL